mgnify:CR=1 FL=1
MQPSALAGKPAPCSAAPLRRSTAALLLSHRARAFFSLARRAAGPSPSWDRPSPLRSCADCAIGLFPARNLRGEGDRRGPRRPKPSLARSLARSCFSSDSLTLVLVSKSISTSGPLPVLPLGSTAADDAPSTVPALRRRPDTRAARKDAGLASPAAVLEQAKKPAIRAKKRALEEDEVRRLFSRAAQLARSPSLTSHSRSRHRRSPPAARGRPRSAPLSSRGSVRARARRRHRSTSTAPSRPSTPSSTTATAFPASTPSSRRTSSPHRSCPCTSSQTAQRSSRRRSTVGRRAPSSTSSNTSSATRRRRYPASSSPKMSSCAACRSTGPTRPRRARTSRRRRASRRPARARLRDRTRRRARRSTLASRRAVVPSSGSAARRDELVVPLSSSSSAAPSRRRRKCP